MNEQRQIAELQRRLATATTENLRLRNLLEVAHGVEPPPAQPTMAPIDPGVVTNASPTPVKLQLYARLFAARSDVYAYYWENPKKQTKGWSPRVRDRYGRGSVWERGPLPLTMRVLEDHLRDGNNLFIGLYPLLPDATCWWLAADFDGPHAMLDAHAYVKAAASLGVPCALEISQSGKGAHVWTFFAEPIPAAAARAMGTACVHRAIGLRGSMALASYDRLFPNQDTAPTGPSGIGNLIAAPLNGERRHQRRTTLFVDLTTWEPWPDQWEFLSTLDRMTPKEVRAAGKAVRIVVGPEATRLEKSSATAIEPKPRFEVRAVLEAGLTIRDEDITPQLAAALRHAATIHNPAFYEAQRARRSTWKIPRFVQGFDVAVSGDLILPRGLREQAASLVSQAGSELVYDDQRHAGTELEVAFAGRLTDTQTAAVDGLLAHADGILHAPPGSGKTVMACAIIAERAVSTLVLVDKKVLAEQWRDQIQSLLGFKAGQLGGGRKKLTGLVDVVLLPTLARRPAASVQELTARYGQVIVDECHHVAAGSYEHSIGQIGASWWLGLTATPPRRDGLEQLTSWQLGPIRHVVRDAGAGAGARQATLAVPFDGPERKLQVHQTGLRTPEEFAAARPGAIAELYGLIASDQARNAQIAADVRHAIEHGRKCLVLSRRRDHLDALTALLTDASPMIMRGGTSKKTLKAIRAKIADAGPTDPLLLMTTIPYGGEGFDAPVIDTVFLAAPISFPGLLIQSVGRALRRHEGKTEVQVHDYVDSAVPVLASQHAKRWASYKQLGFTMPLGRLAPARSGPAV
ncbi:MAG: DEAD/DEAH box helicase [Bifidobacteriaceae bacterium]|nr:DEAD/DEAH box helicase [Bifidobacteriaceae bacterium]